MKKKSFLFLVLICLSLFFLSGCGGGECNAVVDEYSDKMEDAVNSSINSMKNSASSSLGVSAAYLNGADNINDLVDEAKDKLDEIKESGCDESEYEEAIDLLQDNMNSCYDELEETYKEYGQ